MSTRWMKTRPMAKRSPVVAVGTGRSTAGLVALVHRPDPGRVQWRRGWREPLAAHCPARTLIGLPPVYVWIPAAVETTSASPSAFSG